MHLTDINLKGYGRFCAAPATFRCERYGLPAKWDYIYTNGKALLRVQHDGGGYFQVDPPGGPAMFRLAAGAATPALLTWIVPQGAPEASPAFTNFWLPTVPGSKAGTEPESYTCTFAPDAARYEVKHDGWTVATELWVPPDEPAVVMTVAVTNVTRAIRRCRLVSVLNPQLAPFSLAPWDRPELYQTAALARCGTADAIWMETRNPQGNPAKRLRAVVLSDMRATHFEVARHAFEGEGNWSAPGAVWAGGLGRRVDSRSRLAYGRVTAQNAVIGQPIMAGFGRAISLRPGATFEFTLVFGALPPTADGALPPRRHLVRLGRYLRPGTRQRALAALRAQHDDLFRRRWIWSPDAALNRYVNEWLPLQLGWVNSLDRGWPTNLRGTRDAAQDATGSVPLDPSVGRARLLELFSVQRTDGWFPRQYSMFGPTGQHDLRAYVDAGCWVWELLWEYLCYVRDHAILDTRLRWLDRDSTEVLLNHAMRLFDYYLAPANLGEHGLCKIREGDWNDSVNAAGCEGRGETVMVTCQVVLGLEQMAELLASLGSGRHRQAARRYRAAARRLRAALLKHARNRLGYFNGVFNDAGHWIFSPRDPDGRRRINGPANSFAVIAGIVSGAARDRVLANLDGLRGPHGWRLFHPGIGNPPIAKLGRIGAGDLVAGLGENGTCYNHGAHGFLGRAAWTAGRGTLLHEVMRYMLPYDPLAHPVNVAHTAPYGVVNHWKEAPGQEGVGGDTFLSGSITTAIRNCYQGLVGFRPGWSAVVVDPVIPAGWARFEALVPFLGGDVRLCVTNPRHVECGVKHLVLDGQPVDARVRDPILGRTVAVIPITWFKPGSDHAINIVMG